MRSMFAVALCLVASACGPSSASRKEAPTKVTAEEAALLALEADLRARPAPVISTAAAPPTVPPVTTSPGSIAAEAAAPRVTAATFEPVYRAAKGIQGATESGVTYVKFGELMQTFATEVGIAKDHPLNDTDKTLLAMYQKAHAQYQVSSAVWRLKIDLASGPYHGETPVYFEELNDRTLLDAVVDLGVPVTDGTAFGGKRYKSVPPDAAQLIWPRVNSTLDEATKLYLQK